MRLWPTRREICNRNSEPANVAGAFDAPAAGLLACQFEHRLRHGLVTVVASVRCDVNITAQ
jgi:hypothetical protein